MDIVYKIIIYGFVALFVSRSVYNIYKISQFGSLDKYQKKVVYLNIVNGLVILIFTTSDLFAISLLSVITLLTLKGHFILLKIPLVRNFALITIEIKDYFKSNWSITEEYFEEKEKSEFILFSQNRAVRKWKKEVQNILYKKAVKLAELIFYISFIIVIIAQFREFQMNQGNEDALFKAIFNGILAVFKYGIYMYILGLIFFPLILIYNIENFLFVEYKSRKLLKYY